MTRGTSSAQLVDEGLVDPSRVAVLGSSYGGGQAWLLMTTRDDPRLAYGTWRSPRGQLISLAAVVPQYTWSDLLDALVPNGHPASTFPVGVPKITLIDGFLGLGRLAPAAGGLPLARAHDRGGALRARPGRRGGRARADGRPLRVYQDGYFARLAGGRQHAVPVFAAQGVTDPIFSTQELVRMYRRLRAARRNYPIEMYFGDFEHLTSQVKARRPAHDARPRARGSSTGRSGAAARSGPTSTCTWR